VLVFKHPELAFGQKAHSTIEGRLDGRVACSGLW
jgi:hypothetical protein